MAAADSVSNDLSSLPRENDVYSCEKTICKNYCVCKPGFVRVDSFTVAKGPVSNKQFMFLNNLMLH